MAVPSRLASSYEDYASPCQRLFGDWRDVDASRTGVLQARAWTNQRGLEVLGTSVLTNSQVDAKLELGESWIL